MVLSRGLPAVCLVAVSWGGAAARVHAASARTLDEAVSAETLLYVSVPDAVRARRDLAATALAAIAREAEVRRCAREILLPLARALWKSTQDSTPDAFDAGLMLNFFEVQTGLTWRDGPRLADGEAAIALLDVERSGPVLVATVVSRAAADRVEGLARWAFGLALVAKSLPAHPFARGAWAGTRLETSEEGFEAGWARQGERFVFACGPAGTLEKVVAGFSDGVARPLAADPGYRAVRARLDKDMPSLGYAYFNLPRLRARALAAGAGTGAAENALAFLRAAGLSDVGPAGMSLAVADKGFVRRACLLAPAPRAGLLTALADAPPGAFESLALAPAGTHGYMAWRMDPTALWNACRALARGIGGESQARVAEERLAAVLPPPLRRDLAAALGTEAAVTVRQTVGLVPIPEVTLFWRVKDADAAERAIAALLAPHVARGACALQASPDGATPRLTQIRIAGVPVWPAYAVHKGWVVASTGPHPVKAACRRIDGSRGVGEGEKLLSETSDFAAAARRVRRPAAFFTYAEGPDSFRSQYNQMVAMLPVVLMALEQAAEENGAALPECDMTALPTADAIARHLFGSAQTVGGDGEAVFAESFGVLPVNLTDLACAGIATGLVLPSLVRSRQEVSETSARKGLQAIVEASAVYKKRGFSDADGDGVGEYPEAAGEIWKNVVDPEGNPLLPMVQHAGVFQGYRFAIRRGPDPERTFYATAVPEKPGVTGRYVYVIASDGVLHRARADAVDAGDVVLFLNYLVEDGGAGAPLPPFEKVPR